MEGDKAEQVLEMETIEATIDPTHESLVYANGVNYEDGFYINLSPPSSLETFVVSLFIKFPDGYPHSEGLEEHIDFHFKEGMDRYSQVLTVSSFDALSRGGILNQLKKICAEHKGEMTVWFLLEFIRSANYEIVQMNEEGLFGVLPEDLLLNVFQYIDGSYHLTQLSRVNRLWNRLIKDRSIWTALLNKDLATVKFYTASKLDSKSINNPIKVYLENKHQSTTAFASLWPVGLVINQLASSSEESNHPEWENNFLNACQLTVSGKVQNQTFFTHPKTVYKVNIAEVWMNRVSTYEIMFLTSIEAARLFDGVQWWAQAQKTARDCPWMKDNPRGMVFWRLTSRRDTLFPLLHIVAVAQGRLVKLAQEVSFAVLEYKDISDELHFAFSNKNYVEKLGRLWLDKNPESGYLKELRKKVLEMVNTHLVEMKRSRATGITKDWRFIGNDVNLECFERMKHQALHWWVLNTSHVINDPWFYNNS